MSLKYKRVIIKVSGEALSCGDGHTINRGLLGNFCQEIVKAKDLGVEIGVVVGGGNIFRGHTYNDRNSGFGRVKSDAMGMLATVINAIAISCELNELGVQTLLQSSFDIEGICEKFTAEKTILGLKGGKVVVFCGGTGNPFFSTDSAAALRACEIGADIVLKATNIDYVYDSDPKKNPLAKKFEKLTFRDVLCLGLKVMDQTAFVLCMENNIPVRIFDAHHAGNIFKVLQGENLGTFISN